MFPHLLQSFSLFSLSSLPPFCSPLQAKKAREQAALRNAQSLCEELDAERERQESRKKAAAKRRSRRKERRRKEVAVGRQELEVRLLILTATPPNFNPPNFSSGMWQYTIVRAKCGNSY